ncbi:hypothetical protein C4556_02440 [Candidatus Parcubacteria bacterium]|nr:MAG: hypothetical protein C4556_02440 [Candidatus Parcubacteria bacterium]
MHDITGQATRYLATAGIVHAGSILPGSILVESGMSIPMTANVLIVPIAIAKFALYKSWVFKDTLPRWLQQPALYIVIVGAAYGMFLGIQFSGMALFGLTEWTAFGMAFLIVGLLRFLFFRRLFSA